MGGKIGVLLEVNCQTDFVARTDDVRSFCKDVAMHIAGRDPFPLFVSDEEVPRRPGRERARPAGRQGARSGQGQAGHIMAKIVDGPIAKWKEDICLLDQEFVKDPSKDIRTLMLELSAKTGEKITVRRFIRYGPARGCRRRQ